MKKKEISFKTSLLILAFIFSLIVNVQLMADDDDDDDEYMYWHTSFANIQLGTITDISKSVVKKSSAKLRLSEDIYISADNSSRAMLEGPGGDTLKTEYKLKFDGNGSSKSGAANTKYATYDNFLIPPVKIDHTGNDKTVNVKLFVRAKNISQRACNAGSYSATQTLTIAWAD
jgi:hypothetical protein